jgi:hypothetical protein
MVEPKPQAFPPEQEGILSELVVPTWLTDILNDTCSSIENRRSKEG